MLKCLNSDLDHSLTLTTHSPYVLYAINNSMLSFITKINLENATKKPSCIESMINPKDVSIYELKNGYLNSIQQENGLIGDNFFDEKMKEVMDDFYLMLNYI